MLPIDISAWTPTTLWLLSLGVGVAFGAVLETAGFGDSRRLAAQFYLRDMTVLKVMFGAIITAAVLIFLSSALGWLDFSRLFVNHTYLMPQIVGGLIMGVGFIVGGFCPGTSLVAASTLKIDGMVFLVGVALGLFAFGESVPAFEAFFENGTLGRFTIADWLHIDAGWALTGVVVMALAMFYGGELAEAVFGRGQAWKNLPLLPKNPWKIAGASFLLALSLLTALLGQPGTLARWQAVAPSAQGQLIQRLAFVHPLEMVELKQNAALYVTVLDVRPESDYNLFHLKGAWHTPIEKFDDNAFIRRLNNLPNNTVLFVMGQAETTAVAAWKRLQAEHVPNAYIAEGGYNQWWALFPPEACLIQTRSGADPSQEKPTLVFNAAVGERSYASHPDCGCVENDLECPGAEGTHQLGKGQHAPLPKLAFSHKVKVTTKSAKKGGCG